MGKEVKGNFSGLVGNVVFYTVGDQKRVRKRPFRGKRAKNSEKRMAAAKRFGIASKKAKALRQSDAFIFHGINVGKVRHAFDNLALKWVNQEKPLFASTPDMPSLFDGFDFNPESSLSQKLSVSPTFDWQQDGKVVVNFPEIVPGQDIQIPQAKIDAIQWNLQIFSVAAHDALNNEDSGRANFETTINDTASPIHATSREISIRLKAGQIMIVILALRYLSEGLAMADVAWMPTGIIGAAHFD